MTPLNHLAQLVGQAPRWPTRRLRELQVALDAAFDKAMDDAFEIDDGSTQALETAWGLMCQGGAILAERGARSTGGSFSRLPPRIAEAKATAFFTNLEQEL